jgi:hypothetical protein
MPTQEELVGIYNTLKPILKKYENPLKPKMDLDSRYDLWSVKDIVIEGRKRDEVAFAALIIQSNYVGFYFMPTYTHDEIKQVFHPDLLKLLKGKSCFHIKSLTEKLKIHIEDAVEKGFELYKLKGWI